jgi:hypothetical protein
VTRTLEFNIFGGTTNIFTDKNLFLRLPAGGFTVDTTLQLQLTATTWGIVT